VARDQNRFAELEVFVRVAETGSFSAAARALGLSPSAVSKLIGRLETRLEARLVTRSTRRLQLTEAGTGFRERAQRLLGDLEEAERQAGAERIPRGRVRVNSNVPFGLHCLVPLVPVFLARHPQVTLDLTLSDRVVDLLEERADIAIRVGPLRSSQLLARKLGESRLVLVAAPSYLQRAGVPVRPGDLERHGCIDFGFPRNRPGWPFRGGPTLHVKGSALAGDGETARRLALEGVGIARLSAFHIGEDVRAGRLRLVLERFNPGDTEAIHAVYVGQGGPLPARMRVLLDFLAANVKLQAL
jgi:DNA-binding transcriptional LysR family regulator